MGVHFSPPPPAAITRVLSRFDRDALAAFVMVAIDLMDLAEPDADLEPNGDELDGDPAEDEFMYHGGWGPGCPVGDPGGCEHDGREPPGAE
ncbi:hypothetical protein [Sphingomonas sp. HMP6]|uniref:hypothetical protein n=1 Tax=Sphingomonas sp. HMP6 TaxID=1517551 RepID=UPI001596C4F9|nr:hypothetical protein [Sphingomonas sp. HMP6]BCA60054.1 hypothetical protein HMP06_2823 [Sphingomonas sp. HMP6]